VAVSAMIESNYWCFRFWAWEQPEETMDLIGIDVQSLGGWMEPRISSVDFWVPKERASLFLLKWSEHLERHAALDYV